MAASGGWSKKTSTLEFNTLDRHPDFVFGHWSLCFLANSVALLAIEVNKITALVGVGKKVDGNPNTDVLTSRLSSVSTKFVSTI